MRRLMFVLLVFILAACSSPSPEIQNGIIMTPELKNLENIMKAKMDEIMREGEAATPELVSPSPSSLQSSSTPAPVTPAPTKNDNVAIIDTDTSYAYSNKIGFYKEDPYIEGEDSLYRNSKGEVLDRITTIQMRQVQKMPLDERQQFVSQYTQALAREGLPVLGIESLAKSCTCALQTN
jgi:hypothetical protein